MTGWASGGEECRPHNSTTPNPKNPTTKKREWIINSCLKDAAESKYKIEFYCPTLYAIRKKPLPGFLSEEARPPSHINAGSRVLRNFEPQRRPPSIKSMGRESIIKHLRSLGPGMGQKWQNEKNPFSLRSNCHMADRDSHCETS